MKVPLEKVWKLVYHAFLIIVGFASWISCWADVANGHLPLLRLLLTVICLWVLEDEYRVKAT